ncbi:restriction endonuclease subunit S [Microcoleus sp. herbarium2]|uniref:restriction endonuclease subunit S n=1 Tax=Microcoleus sp. herbarium2 TaxID=3055433 RepID=UPI002FD05BB8
MRSNYKKLDAYIREIDIRNIEGKKENLLGVSTQKVFIKSIANTEGTDWRSYKIVKKRQFTYVPDTSRRGDKIAIALLEDEDHGLVSQAYTVFEIVDTEKLLPEYLMMWFRRPEFDRYARFMSYGSVREIFSWEEMCNMELPIPDIAKQREIVKEYNVLVNRIALNNQLIQKLEETAQAIYKQWFVDFEFPDENGKPYKSNGGEMVESQLGEIPKGWKVGSLNEIVDVIDGDRGTDYPSNEEISDAGFCLFLNAGNVTSLGFDFSKNNFISKEKDKLLRKGKLQRNDVLMTSRGTVGNVAYFSDVVPFDNIRINSGMVILRSKNILESSIFIYIMLRNTEMKMAIENYLSGSAQPQLPIKDLIKIPVLVPCEKKLLDFANIATKLQKYIDRAKIHNLKLHKFVNIILSKLATVEE